MPERNCVRCCVEEAAIQGPVNSALVPYWECSVLSCHPRRSESLDPSVTGRFTTPPTTMPILTRIDAIEPGSDLWGQTTSVTPEDLVPSDLSLQGDLATPFKSRSTSSISRVPSSCSLEEWIRPATSTSPRWDLFGQPAGHPTGFVMRSSGPSRQVARARSIRRYPSTSPRAVRSPTRFTGISRAQADSLCRIPISDCWMHWLWPVVHP